jgi:hypothetical protein
MSLMHDVIGEMYRYVEYGKICPQNLPDEMQM